MSDVLTLKKAFLDGAQAALRQYGILPEEEPSTFQKALPWIAAAGIGGLGYKYLRHPSFSKNPSVAKSQAKAVDKGFHRVIDVSRKGKFEPDPDTTSLMNLYYRGLHWLKPSVNRKGNLDWANRAKLWAQEGGEAIPVAGHKGKIWVPGHNKPLKVKGIVSERHIETDEAPGKPPRDIIRGGQDVEGPMKTQRALTRMGEEGKGFEADVLQKHVPHAIPQTYTDIHKQFKGLSTHSAKARVKSIRKLQQRLIAFHGNNKFLMKPTIGLQSGGKFPFSYDNWGKQLAAYERHAADPKNAAKLKTLATTNLEDLAFYLAKHDIAEGAVLRAALENPRNILTQHKVRRALGEFRVHIQGGEAPRSLILDRMGDPIGLAKAHLGLGPFTARDLKQFAEETVAQMPKKYQQGSYAMDIMPHLSRNGNVKFKVLELNPSERAHGQGKHWNPGGGSGFLDASSIPHAGWAHYRARTGRHTTPVALAGGLAAASAAGGIANAFTPSSDDE